MIGDYEDICATYGSWKGFIDSKSKRVTGHIDYDQIDTEMRDIIKRLNDAGIYIYIYSVLLLRAWKRPAHVTFDTSITLERLATILNHSVGYDIHNEQVSSLFGESDCVYYTVRFRLGSIGEIFNM